MNAYTIVADFEKAVAEYAGSKYAVAVDTCTAALFLCCKYLQVETVELPSRTFHSVPNAVVHAGGKIRFSNDPWRGCYVLAPYPIIDSALRFQRQMYAHNTFTCLSFHYRKHLPIGRGGMILTDSAEAVEWFKMARFHGRAEAKLGESEPQMIGWGLYMEPERAARGLTLLMYAKDHYPDLVVDYPDLSQMAVYKPYLTDV